MERWETWMILFAGLALGLFGIGGRLFVGQLVGKNSVDYVWPFIEVLAPTLGCLVLIWGYKRQRVGCYPSTFIYCFNMPEDSNPSGKRKVVGFCYVDPDMATGELIVEGASFYWDNGRISNRVGFRSTQVHGVEVNGETTCEIRFTINEDDQDNRNYRHGLLQFRLTNPSRRSTRAEIVDAYAGYLRNTRNDVEIQDVDVRGRGYAEWCAKGKLSEDDAQAILGRSGDVLFGKLDHMLQSTPWPSLWRNRVLQSSNKFNVWRDEIPTPQSVLLDPKMEPYIDKLLQRVLTLYGLNNAAIDRFKELALNQARVEAECGVVAFEHSLKSGLINQIDKNKANETLYQRANIIYDEIKEFIVGDSLLDIGCGNGLVCSLIKHHLRLKPLLLDVVRYVPRELGLDFVPYREGQRLPVSEPFDTVLLLVVLHHSRNPEELLDLAWAATRKRLIIIESVVGVHKLESKVKYDLVALTDKEQFAYAAFVDWFYNRVLHDNVPVPYNFTTPEKWRSIFIDHKMDGDPADGGERHGQLTHVRHLGQDIEIGPEYHILFVLDKPDFKQVQ
jgi:2-polyprenyl-3-methyl-5-hydroxy-6-metoxy-1,4-benzoquinol methylase